MAAKLKIICTPIGNLGDMTPRALQAIRDSALILAEDTRHSRKLLSHFQIDLLGRRLISCHQHNELERLPAILERLKQGDSVALLTDAGAPSVSDPGGRLVEAVIDAGFPIEVFPGASALTAALMGAGLDTSRHIFLGFLPRKAKEQTLLFESVRSTGFALVIFEAANRVTDTLAALFKAYGARRVVVARELTKQYETFHRGRLGEALSPEFVEAGECVVVVDGGEAFVPKKSTLTLAERVQQLLDAGLLSPKQIAKQVARELDLSTKEVYACVVQTKSA